jgi:hypothetical protein
MLSPQEYASQVDGAVIEAEIDRLSSLHSADAVETATRLSRRINRTVEWNPLGPEGARFRLMTSRGEAVVFWDDADGGERVIKLRGREENGFDTTGFGCILGRNARGLIELQPGTLAQAVIRESLCWEQFGFGCTIEEVIGEDAGLLLAQRWIRPDTTLSPRTLQQRISQWMNERGWEPLRERSDVSVSLRNHAWHRDGMGAFDTNETNFILSAEDGALYPIDLVVWPLPE